MLRVYLLQQWFNLSGPGMKEARYESVSIRRFAGTELNEMPAPGESMLLRFCRSLEKHALGEKAVPAGVPVLGTPGHQDWHRWRNCPCHDYQGPALHDESGQAVGSEKAQTKSGNHWDLEIKGHIGVDVQTQVMRAVAATPANVHDSVCLAEPFARRRGARLGRPGLSGTERGYPKNMHSRRKASRTVATVERVPWIKTQGAMKETKLGGCVKVEHLFLIIKRLFQWGDNGLPNDEKRAHRPSSRLKSSHKCAPSAPLFITR